MRLHFHTVSRSRRSAEELRTKQNTIVLAAAIFTILLLFLHLLLLHNLLHLLLQVVDVVAPPRMGRGFRWLLSSSWVSNIGDGIALAAGPLLVASQTRNAVLVAMAALLQRLHWLLFGLWAGAIEDRLARRVVVIVAALLRALVVAALTVAIVTDQVSIAIVLAADGTIHTKLGDPSALILARSSLKPLQALACLSAGAPLEGERLGLATASHSGTDRHVAVVRDILDGVDDVHFAELTSHDVVRHRLVSAIVDAYEADEVKRERSERKASGAARERHGRESRGSREARA